MNERAARSCGPGYDSHAWQWHGREHCCERCGLVDLDAQRLMRMIIAKLEALNVTVAGVTTRP